jgi:hypothetical protein
VTDRNPRGNPDALDDFSEEFTGQFMGGPQVDEDYEAAPLEFSLAQARAMFSRLYGAALELLPAAGADPAPCDECGERTLLFRYGLFAVCRPCAFRRRRAPTHEVASPLPSGGAALPAIVGPCQRCDAVGRLEIVDRRFLCSSHARRARDTQRRRERYRPERGLQRPAA